MEKPHSANEVFVLFFFCSSLVFLGNQWTMNFSWRFEREKSPKMASTRLPPKKRAKADLSAALYAAAEVGNTSPSNDLDIDDDDDGPVWEPEFDLAPRIDRLPRHDDAEKAMRVSRALRLRAVKHVMWWNTFHLNPRAKDIYPLSNLTFTHNTGVHSFGLEADCCTKLWSFLENPQNYNAEGWLVVAGKPFPGYSHYPYVQSPFGQVAVIQEVSVHPILCDLAIPSLGMHPTFDCPCAAAQDSTHLWQAELRHCFSWPARGAGVGRRRPVSSQTS